MGDNEQKALQLMAEAEKKLTQQKGFLGSLFGWVYTAIVLQLEYQLLIVTYIKYLQCGNINKQTKISFVQENLQLLYICVYIVGVYCKVCRKIIDFYTCLETRSDD